MAAGHRATAAPCALGYAWTLVGTGVAPGPLAIAAGVLVIGSSTWPDLDHPRFKGRIGVAAFFAWVTRFFAAIGYMIRTEGDVRREDYHRGPSHCIEWAILLGGVVTLLVGQAVPMLVEDAWTLGLAVTIGCVSHVFADAMTPAGVPISAVYNMVVHREVWRRHSLGLFATDSCGEHMAWTPAFYAITGVMFLGMVGLLGPVSTLLVGL